MEPCSSMAQTSREAAQVCMGREKGPAFLRMTAVSFVVAFAGQWPVSMFERCLVEAKGQRCSLCQTLCVWECHRKGSGFEEHIEDQIRARGSVVMPRLRTHA